MKNAIDKYLAASSAADRWSNIIESELRPVFTRYKQLQWDYQTNIAKGECFPDWVENIEKCERGIIISGTSSYRGCTDRDSATVPMKLAMTTAEEREAIFAQMEADLIKAKAEHEHAEQQRAAEAERAQFVALKQKYEGMDHD